jgi:hypothetical protein
MVVHEGKANFLFFFFFLHVRTTERRGFKLVTSTSLSMVQPIELSLVKLEKLLFVL